MDNTILNLDQFSSSTRAAFAIAAAQLCFIKNGDTNPVALSRCTSAAVGRPVLVVSLEHLPHSKLGDNGGVKLSKKQAEEHGRILKKIESQAFPAGNGFPKEWDWNQSGQMYTPNSSSWRVNTPKPDRLPFSMTGDFWVKAAILTTIDRTWTNRDLWSGICGLAPEKIEHIPAGDAVRAYNIGHEVGHVLQLCPERLIPDARWDWATEKNADSLSFAGLNYIARTETPERKAEFDETIKAVIHGRALSAFRAATPQYINALPLNGIDNVTYEQAVLCNREIRFRVYAEMEGIKLPSSSDDVQRLITQWEKGENSAAPLVVQVQKAFGNPWVWNSDKITPMGKWSKYHSDLERAIPALDRIAREGQITDPMTLRNAQLIIDAAVYFCPSLQSRLPERPSAPAFFAHRERPLCEALG